MTVKPEIHDGLSYAETMQLGFDHLAQDLITKEIQRFYGIHVDAVDSLADHINVYHAHESAHSKLQATYDDLHKWGKQLAGQPSDPVKEAALRAAGGVVFKSKNDLKEEHAKITEEGTELSLETVAYFNRRLPETEVVLIQGVPYELKYDVLTRKIGGSTLAFACGEEHAKIARETYGNSGKNVTRVATIKDWQVLIDSLRTIAKF